MLIKRGLVQDMALLDQEVRLSGGNADPVFSTRYGAAVEALKGAIAEAYGGPRFRQFSADAPLLDERVKRAYDVLVGVVRGS